MRLPGRLAAASVLAIGLLSLAASDARAATRELTYSLANNLFGVPIYVGIENGYWEKKDIDVKLMMVTSGREVTEALQTGQAQLGGISFSTTIPSARASGMMLKGVLPSYNNAVYVAQGAGRGIVGRKDRGIVAGDPKSLIGKKIAYLAGSTQDVYIRAYLQRVGIDLGQVTLVNVPVPNMPITLTQGLVDAASPWEPYVSQAVRELGANGAVITRSEPGLLADPVGIGGTEAFIAKNPALIYDFALGLAQAAQFVRANPADAARITVLYVDGLNEADAAEGIKQMSWDPRLSVCTDAGLTRSAADMVKQGLIKAAQPIMPADLRDRSVSDRLLAEHAELFSDLEKLPSDVADCKGQLSAP